MNISLQSGEIDDKVASEFKDRVYKSIMITEGVQWGLIALGSLLLLVVIIVALIRRCKQVSTEVLHVDPQLYCILD